MIEQEIEIKKLLLKNSFEKFDGYFHPSICKIRNDFYKKSEIYFNNIKSPMFGQIFSFNSEHRKNFSYSYERNLSHKTIEDRYQTCYEKISYCKNIFFNSGIASIFNSLVMLKRILNKDKLKILSHYSYFETIMINNVLMNDVEEYENIFLVNDFDVIFIESVRYDENMSTKSMEEVLRDIKKINNFSEPLFIIIDSTLYRDVNGMKKLLEDDIMDNIIILEITSFLKLHQFGMEISNVGCVSVYSSKKNMFIVDEIAVYMKKLRNITGTNLSLFELSLLSNDILFKNELIDLYKNKIYHNCRKMKNSILKGNIINIVSYPKSDFFEAPFVILQNESFGLNDYIMLLSIIKKNVEDRGLNIFIGSSFGFNNTRYELVITNRKEETCFLKISVGAFDDTSQNEFVKIINELNKYKSKNELFLENKNVVLLEFGEDYE